MAFSGLKKQLNKANQYLSEKVGGVEATKLDDSYIEMEKKTDITSGLVEELQIKTKDYLQLNTPILALGGGRSKPPQSVGLLGECMLTYGRKLEDSDSNSTANALTQALKETGESLRILADLKSDLDDKVKENFLKPLSNFQTRDLKDVEHLRSKLQSRRLDFDSKKKRQQEQSLKSGSASGSVLNENEIWSAAGKFNESYTLAQIGMHNLMEKNVEKVYQLSALAESLHEYHFQCAEIMKNLSQALEAQKFEMERYHPGTTFIPKRLIELDIYLDSAPAPSPPAYSRSNSSYSSTDSGIGQKSPNGPVIGIPARNSQLPPPRPMSRPVSVPFCEALYDFQTKVSNELAFNTGDIIQLIRRIDQDWFEGTLNGRTGYFPVSYVNVLVPLP